MFHTTQLLLDRASSYQKAGQWQSAVDLCESIFDSSWRAERLDDVLEVLLRLALLYNSRSDQTIAGEYYGLVYTIASESGHVQQAGSALNGLGIISQRSGDLDTAVAYYSRARQLATEARDRHTAGDVELNLGIVANIRGELKSSLKHYKKALREYGSIGDQRRMARVLNNLGMLYLDLNDLTHSANSLDRARHLCRLIGDIQVEGIILTNKTELLVALGDLESARMCCDEAFEIASKLGHEELKAEVLKLYGVLFREIRKPHLAESHLMQAIEIAALLNYPLIEADAYRELSLVLRSDNRNKEALEALNRAHALFVGLQAKHEQADIDKRFAQLEADFLVLVEMWGESIEAKDRYTRGHCQRVADYACRLAEKAGLPSRDLVWFRMGAFLHDVGKTEVPESILNKPGKLTDEERRVIESHTVAGDEILSATDFPYDIRPMVRWHHERWDGNGYPDRLCGEKIPFTARLLHIVDVYDALTTARSYREPLAACEALAVMEADEGSFDPDLFELFKSMVDEFHQLAATAHSSAAEA